jgi:hypothetical protein
MSKEYPTNKKPSCKFDEQKFNEAIRDMNSHLDALEIQFPGLFKFREIKTVFNVDNIYLTESNPKSNDSKSIKSYNGVALKKLTIKTHKCDIRNQMNFLSDGYEDSEIKEPEKKKFRRSVSSNSSTNSPNRRFSRNSRIRQALSSSIDSYQETERSMIDEKTDSEVEHSVNYDFNSEHNSQSISENDFDSDENCDRNNSINNYINNSNGNREHLDDLGTNGSTHLKTVTVLGNSPQILHINDTNKSTTFNNSNNDLTNGRIHTTCDIRRNSKDRVMNNSVPIMV